MITHLSGLVPSEYQTIGHYDGSVSVLFTLDHEPIRINLQLRATAWTVHGHIDEPFRKISEVGHQLADALKTLSFDFELSFLADAESDPIALVDSRSGPNRAT